ncbi:MAG TPA: T9SS type A sorting domain-containing protein [Bacteroidota bacterium]|nr:T9SS type A sorting domain-containing protein [Bacteroidota bacterium]
MKKTLTTLFALALLCSTVSLAQWTYRGSFPNDNLRGTSGAHGLAVDPAGKIWIQFFGNSDSIFNGTSMVPCKAIYAFNQDGSPASFSPIRVITVGGVPDTLFGGAVDGRGLRADHQGNILASVQGKLYRINYQTGAGMNKITEPGSIGAVGVDNFGEIFVGRVVGGNPIKIYNASFTLLGNVTDTSVGFHRAFEASGDGNDVYWAGYTNHAIYRYHSDNGSFGPYAVGPNDTLLKGFDCESMGWNPARTRLWASSGSKNDRPNRWPDPSVVTNYSVNTWYAYDPVSNTVTDSITWNFTFSQDSINIRPRGIAFSNNGDTAYVGCFGGSTYPAVQKFARGPSSVRPDPNGVPNGFVLSQNYPNPFNPGTEINFTITRAGLTTLVVYDMLGREVATLVSENLTAGAYTATFDASRLSSGTYMYTLTSGGNRISKKMMLVK